MRRLVDTDLYLRGCKPNRSDRPADLQSPSQWLRMSVAYGDLVSLYLKIRILYHPAGAASESGIQSAQGRIVSPAASDPRARAIAENFVSSIQPASFDADYVQRLIDGDPKIQCDFVTFFGKLLCFRLRRVRGAEDIRQETFLRVLRALKRNRLADPTKIGAFINGVCKNVLAEHYRSASRVAPAPDRFDIPGKDPDPEVESGIAERKHRVHQVLEKLPAKDREILRLLFVEEQEREEVCRICRVGRSYLRVLLHRAKNRFREELLGPLSSSSVMASGNRKRGGMAGPKRGFGVAVA
jgi:RNA polymerase sigma-70 factor, ECF subfamily